MSTPAQTEELDTPAKQLLKRAFVLTSYGYFEEALAVCEEAARLADDDLVPKTIHGAILTASGRPSEAMRDLMKLYRSHKDAILTALYLAEACFLAGRHRRGFKLLDDLDPQALEESPWAEFAAQLRETWQDLQELDDLPKPLTVPLEEDA